MPDAVDSKIIKGFTITTGPGSKADILPSQRPLVAMSGTSASCYGTEKRDKLGKAQCGGQCLGPRLGLSVLLNLF